MTTTHDTINEAKLRARSAKIASHAARQSVLDIETQLRDAKRAAHEAEAQDAEAQADVYDARAQHYLGLYETTEGQVADQHRRRMIWNSNRAGEYREDAYQIRRAIA